MRKLVMLLMLIVGALASPYNMTAVNACKSITSDNKQVIKYVTELENLSYKQLVIFKLVYKAFLPMGLAEAASAISFKESKFGKYRINSVTGDYGIMGVNLHTFLNAINEDAGYWRKLELASDLATDDSLNIAASMHNLKYWEKVSNGNLKVMYGSYNGGWRPNKQYASDIVNIRLAINMFFNRHHDIYEAFKND